MQIIENNIKKQAIQSQNNKIHNKKDIMTLLNQAHYIITSKINMHNQQIYNHFHQYIIARQQEKYSLNKINNIQEQNPQNKQQESFKAKQEGAKPQTMVNKNEVSVSPRGVIQKKHKRRIINVELKSLRRSNQMKAEEAIQKIKDMIIFQKSLQIKKSQRNTLKDEWKQQILQSKKQFPTKNTIQNLLFLHNNKKSSQLFNINMTNNEINRDKNNFQKLKMDAEQTKKSIFPKINNKFQLKKPIPFNLFNINQKKHQIFNLETL